MKPTWTSILAALVLCAAACSSGTGTDACVADEECRPGTHCKLGECAFDCTRDSDCPAGFACTVRGRCERGCTLTNGGLEACDGVDNDCDEETDENFDNLGTACAKGTCTGTWVCSADGTAEECDVPDPAGDDTTCDDVDEDCDGETDEDAGPRDCELQAGVCVGAFQTCEPGGQWSQCDYGPDYTEGIDDQCDQLDNDCDGETDEDTPPQLEPEDGLQATDGIDNNCNRLVDEGGGVLVPMPSSGSVWIDAFESAVFEHPDCTGTHFGQVSDDYPAGFPPEGMPTVELYACSLPGVIPSGHLSYYRARWACQAQGKRLCSHLELSIACRGLTSHSYPYGTQFVPGVCNDALGGSGAAEPTGSRPECTAGMGTFDLSGNMGEWASDWDDEVPGNALTLGFHYFCELCYEGDHCQSCDLNPGEIEDQSGCVAQRESENTFPVALVKPYLGARCCLELP